ncbi:MAG: RluA family pseudouridine synthase [Bacteroidales bacterium]|nr:RluA family pseudouridine synthase [Candidatus Sodaliphilus limicaballi]
MKRNHNHRVPRATDKSLSFTVREECGLLDFVMKCLDGISRNKAKSILTKGGALVDGRVQTHHEFRVLPGSVVNISRQPRPKSDNSQHYRIVYEDRWIVVVDKEPGVLSMGVGAGSLNMKNLLDKHFVDTRQRCTAHVVHRLDCRTSGLMVYAKSSEVQQDMTADWRATVTDRRYVALVEGVMEQTEGRVESYLKDTKRMVVISSPTDNGGKFAVTTWRLMEQGKQHAMLELKLLTGRKNQIRVHMADIHHPVVGDGKYGSQDDPGSRMCLHAFKLAIKHPVTGEEMAWETPIPPYFYRRMR